MPGTARLRFSGNSIISQAGAAQHLLKTRVAAQRVTGVAGTHAQGTEPGPLLQSINDDVAAGGLVAGGIATLQGTCGTCHDTPSVGNHSFPTPLNIGTGDPSPTSPFVNLGGLDLSYLPQITVCQKDPTTGDQQLQNDHGPRTSAD